MRKDVWFPSMIHFNSNNFMVWFGIRKTTNIQHTISCNDNFVVWLIVVSVPTNVYNHCKSLALLFDYNNNHCKSISNWIWSVRALTGAALQTRLLLRDSRRNITYQVLSLRIQYITTSAELQIYIDFAHNVPLVYTGYH